MQPVPILGIVNPKSNHGAANRVTNSREMAAFVRRAAITPLHQSLQTLQEDLPAEAWEILVPLMLKAGAILMGIVLYNVQSINKWIYALVIPVMQGVFD